MAFDSLLKPQRPPTPPKTAALTPASSKRPDNPSLPKWLDDVRTAKAVAKAQHKDILLEITRPVTSGDPKTAPPAKTLLDSELFLDHAGATFVLLRLTASPQMPDRTIARVSGLVARTPVTRFPTFVLLDSNGKPYARSELISQRVSAYRREFDRLQQIQIRSDRQLALAAVTTGAECDYHLDAVLRIVNPLADTEYAELEQRVTALDPQNKAGLKAKYQAAVLRHKTESEIQREVSPLMERWQFQAALARIDWLMVDAKLSRDQRQRLLAFKGQAYCGLGDPARSAKVLAQAIAIDPNSESGRVASDLKQHLPKSH